MKGCFVVYENEDEQFDIKCDLRPDVEDEVPELQSLLYSEIENTCNVLKALDKTSDEIKRKYFKKLLTLAQVGLVPENSAQPKMAMVALDKLKTEMLHIEGKRIKNQYIGFECSFPSGCDCERRSGNRLSHHRFRLRTYL